MLTFYDLKKVSFKAMSTLGKDSVTIKSEEFDPIAYIENAFRDSGSNSASPAVAEPREYDELEIPSMGEFLGKSKVAQKPKARRESTKRLSAPRPRRVRSEKSEVAVIAPEVSHAWTRLPKNLEFLSSFFDDKVTSNYYRGDFKESREELIQRLVDPELSLEEVSRLLGVCPATVRRYTNRNWLDHHRTQGGQRRFRLTSVVKFVEQHGRTPKA